MNERLLMRKNAQITIFLILGIALLLIILLVLSTNSPSEQLPHDEISQIDFTQIENYLEECLSKAAYQASWKVAKQGGYTEDYFIGSSILIDGEYKVKYIEGFDFFYPSLEELNESIALETENILLQCVDLSPFLLQGFTFEDTDISLKVTLNEEDATFLLSYPLLVKKEDTSYTIPLLSQKIPIPFKRMQTNAETIVNNLLSSQNYDFVQDCQSYDLRDSEKIITDEVLIQIISESLRYDNEPLIYQFIALGHNFEGECIQ